VSTGVSGDRAISDVTFREVEDGDVEQVVALWTDCGLTRPWNDPHLDVADARRNPTSSVLVGVLGERLVSTAMVGYDGHRGWVYYLAVAPDLQGSGLGRATMAAAEARLGSAGVRKVRLMVRAGNEAVVRFYESLGYADSGAAQVLGRDLPPLDLPPSR